MRDQPTSPTQDRVCAYLVGSGQAGEGTIPPSGVFQFRWGTGVHTMKYYVCNMRLVSIVPSVYLFLFSRKADLSKLTQNFLRDYIVVESIVSMSSIVPVLTATKLKSLLTTVNV